MKQIITIGIDGMHCASCSSSVEKTLFNTPGVFSANVNLPLEEAVVEYDDKTVNITQLKAAITGIGFQIREETSPDDETEQEDIYIKAQRKALFRMFIGWIFTLAVMAIMFPHMFLDRMMFSNHVINVMVITGLSLATMLIPAWQVYVSAFKSISHGLANMDVLIALGTLAAVATGPLSMIIEVADFSGIAAMIIAFHLTGRYLESRAKGKASEAIRKLMNLGAKTAILLKDGIESEISVQKIRVNDILVVKPGSIIPTDGVIIEGISSINESMATGEAMPVTRKEGELVIGATINQEGRLIIKATKIGKDTFLAQIVKLVKDAQHSKVPIQVLADKVVGVFVPIVLSLAAITFIAWFLFPDRMQQLNNILINFVPWTVADHGRLGSAMMSTIAVLVIACPCALGLATPTALMVGSGIGAAKGVLIRNGEALQLMKDVKVMVFDKTGTLTFGKPELIKLLPLNTDENTLLKLGASLEAGSEHPMAHAIVDYALQRNINLAPISNFKSIPGKGIQAEIENMQYYAGSEDFVAEQGLDVKQIVRDLPLAHFTHASRIYLADATNLLGVFLVADTIKPEAAAIIKELKSLGIKPVMLSGDNELVAKAIARQCGIEHILANVLPEDKAIQIRNLQSQLGIVVMVGDGINDAPALKQADIGIAMGQGTDIAMEAADITIIRSELSALITAIKLSKATFSKIKQNLFWAFFYNLIAIPLAIMGYLHPVIAELAMATSSVTVITNANLLRKVKL